MLNWFTLGLVSIAGIAIGSGCGIVGWCIGVRAPVSEFNKGITGLIGFGIGAIAGVSALFYIVISTGR